MDAFDKDALMQLPYLTIKFGDHELVDPYRPCIKLHLNCSIYNQIIQVCTIDILVVFYLCVTPIVSHRLETKETPPMGSIKRILGF